VTVAVGRRHGEGSIQVSGVGAASVRIAGRALAAVAASAADLLMPPRCAGCDAPGTLLCERCRPALPLIEREEACPRCGAPDGRYGCAECGRLDLTFSGARCAGVFEWPLSRLVTLHKDAGELRLTAVLAKLAADAAGEWTAWADVVVPVPASPGALARRGFDHGALLATEFAYLTGVPAFDALRAMPRRDQRRLSAERRARNARTSLAAWPGVHLPARVLVIDDVMTTGATIEAATLALLGAGAGEVRAVGVARACSGRL
jgi:predicted amidophosphoribosyltransferase